MGRTIVKARRPVVPTGAGKMAPPTTTTTAAGRKRAADEDVDTLRNQQAKQSRPLAAEANNSGASTSAATAEPISPGRRALSDLLADLPREDTEATTEEMLERESSSLLCVFGDCDPEHIRTKLRMLSEDPKRVETLYEDLYRGRKEYPKMRTRLEQEHHQRQQVTLQSFKPSVQQLVYRYIDDEEASFPKSRSTARSPLYMSHSVALMANKFTLLPVPYITKVLKTMNNVVPAYQKLEQEHQLRCDRPRAPGKRGTYLIKPRTEVVAPPTELDEQFMWDHHFIMSRDEIDEFVSQRSTTRDKQYRKAKRARQLKECSVCIEKVLPDDLLPCSQGEHLFCSRCIRLTSCEHLRMGKTGVPCLDPECTEQVAMASLEKALPYSLWTLLQRRMLEEDLLMANLEGLHHCPHCSYAVVFPEDSKCTVLQCENPTCFQASCRFCKASPHCPFTCEEIGDAKTKLSRHLEKEMADAIIRVCPKCQTHFIKESGCNNMTCPKCHTVMCYFCKEINPVGYKHFTSGSRCTVLDPSVIHTSNLADAVPRAMKEFLEANPAAEDVKLGFDPLTEWV